VEWEGGEDAGYWGGGGHEGEGREEEEKYTPEKGGGGVETERGKTSEQKSVVRHASSGMLVRNGGPGPVVGASRRKCVRWRRVVTSGIQSGEK